MLMNTLKTLVVGDTTWLRTAPEGSFLKRLSKKELQEVYSLSDLRKMQANGIDRYILFAISGNLVYVMNLLSDHAKQKGFVAFIQSSSFYENLIGFGIRSNLEENKKRFINGR